MQVRLLASAIVVGAAVIAPRLESIGSVPLAAQQGPPGQGAAQLPDGPGKELVQTACSRCHGVNLITNSWGYTKHGWEDRIHTMLVLPKDQMEAITTYLEAHFPPKPVPGAILISGPAQVKITEWMVPTLGSRPHDPLAAADGSIWWTGQYADKLGRLDPRTGAMKEFPLPPRSGPHGLIEDRAGHIWYTAISGNYIGKLDPRTGEVSQYPVAAAEPAARGPHTPIFDQKGTLWFTLQSGHVGRLVPATGEMKIVASPSGKASYPYGIKVNSQGVPWYVDFRGNRVASVDPVTMTIKEYPLPDPAARPRRIAITPDDLIWYTDFARGYLGRFDPKTGAVKEWLSPGGRESEPYGIAATGSIIWYSESGVRPNTLVRFDPASEQFQTWAIPSGGGVIRHMMATPTGNLVLACSGVNRVALVEVQPSGTTSRRTP
jgi:virginiamycin B lyase